MGLAVFEQPAPFVGLGPKNILGAFKKQKKADRYLQNLAARGIVAAIVQIEFARARSLLRLRMFEQYGYRCAKCSNSVTWDTGHMHERIKRSQGGDRTLHNCEILCPDCHIGPRGEHP